jgi:uncharacterized protein YegL
MSNEHPAVLRRLPVYLLLDCSGSMAGEPIAAMGMGLKALLSDLRNDPQALETVWLSLLTFSSAAEQLLPLTDISEFDTPELTASGTTALGEAVRLLAERIQDEVRKTTADQKGDWRPLVFILTDGEPTDDWQGAVEDFRVSNLATVIACGAGPEVNDRTLRLLGDTVVRLKDTQPGTLGAFMRWVTASVSTTSQGLGTRRSSALPLPEQEGISVLVNDGTPCVAADSPGADPRPGTGAAD